jgi:hypothetical protein
MNTSTLRRGDPVEIEIMRAPRFTPDMKPEDISPPHREWLPATVTWACPKQIGIAFKPDGIVRRLMLPASTLYLRPAR